MQEVSRNIQKVAESLFSDPGERESFLGAIIGGGSLPTSALVWCRERPSIVPFTEQNPFAWTPEFLSFVDKASRPGKSELHERGYFYVMDVTSALCGSLLLAIENNNTEKVLDVCAAPGGKTVFAWRALRPSKLISNEVIKKRIPALVSNIKRCGLSGVSVASTDPSILGEMHKDSCDLVIVDAPCSGQSLPVKGEKAGSPFHPTVINRCAMRQRRVLAASSSAVSRGGYLAYFTCTFSKEENEGVISWFLGKNPEYKCEVVPHLKEYRSKWSEYPSYRFFPDSASGAGGFGALLKRE